MHFRQSPIRGAATHCQQQSDMFHYILTDCVYRTHFIPKRGDNICVCNDEQSHQHKRRYTNTILYIHWLIYVFANDFEHEMIIQWEAKLCWTHIWWEGDGMSKAVFDLVKTSDLSSMSANWCLDGILCCTCGWL